MNYNNGPKPEPRAVRLYSMLPPEIQVGAVRNPKILALEAWKKLLRAPRREGKHMGILTLEACEVLLLIFNCRVRHS
jgi:hypothetical protein